VRSFFWPDFGLGAAVSPKKASPFQRVPVISRATELNER
jgi:hypothetical protein